MSIGEERIILILKDVRIKIRKIKKDYFIYVDDVSKNFKLLKSISIVLKTAILRT